MTESRTSIRRPLQPVTKLPTVNSAEVEGFFQSTTRLEESAQRAFRNQTEAEATRQGIVDGQQGKFNTDLLYAPTFRGKAYTLAAQKSFLDTVELNATRRIQEIIQKNPTNSAKAKDEINGYLNGVVQGFPPAIRQRLGQTFLLRSQIRANVGLGRIQNRENRREILEQETKALEIDNQRSRDVVSNAEGILDPNTDISGKSIAAVVQMRQQIKSDYDAKITDIEANEIGAHNPAFRQRALEQFDADTSNAAIKSAFNQAQNKEEYLRQFQANEIDLEVKDEFGDIVLDLRPSVRQKQGLINYMQAQISRENVKVDARRRQLKGAMNRVISDIKAGGQADDTTISEIKTRAHQLGMEDEFESVADWVNHGNDMHNLSVQSPANADALVSAERADIEDRRDAGESISDREVEQLESKESLVDTISTQLEKDPIGHANTVGLIEKSPLIFSPQETIEVDGQQIRPQDLFEQRITQAEAVANHYGRPPVYTTPEERTAFANQFADRATSPKDKVALLASLAGFGDRQRRVMAEIAPQSPGYMHLAGLFASGSMPHTIEDAAEGMAIIQGSGTIEGTRIITTGTPAVREQTDLVLGTAFSDSPDTRKQVVAVAEAIYTARMFREGRTGEGDLDLDAWQRSLQEASGANFLQEEQFGGIGEYHGTKIVIPNYIKSEDFQGLINNLEDQDWRDAGENGGPVELLGDKKTGPISMTKEIDVRSDDIQLHAIGDGQYLVSRNKDGAPFFYRGNIDPDSEVGWVRAGHYVLNINKLSGTRRIRAARIGKSFFVTEDEIRENEERVERRRQALAKEPGPDLVPGPRDFGEDVESIKQFAQEQLEKTKEFVRKLTGKEAEEFVKGTIEIVEDNLQSVKEFFTGAEPPDTLTQELIDVEEKAKELQRNRSNFNKLPKSKKTKAREKALNDRALVLHNQAEKIKKKFEERRKQRGN